MKSDLDSPVYRSLQIDAEDIKIPRLGINPTYRSLGGSESLFPSPSPLAPYPKVTDLSSFHKSFQSFHISPSISSSTTTLTGPVQDCPIYFESNSSFLTNRSPKETFDAVLLTLHKQNIDHDYKPLKHKIKGVYYNENNGSPCTFIIKLFKAPSGSKAKYLLEIQKRFGCSFGFRKLYQQFIQALAVQDVATPFNPPTSSTSLPPLGQTILDKGTLEILLKGLGKSSANLEHLREIIRLLSSYAKSAQNRAVLVDSQSTTNLWDILAGVLEMQDGEVRRCGAAFLGCMAVEQNIRSELISKLLASMLRLLSGSKCDSSGFGHCSDFLHRDAQRQIVHALSLIAETHAKQIVQNPSFSQYAKTLTNLQSSGDNVLRGDVLVTLEYLKH